MHVSLTIQRDNQPESVTRELIGNKCNGRHIGAINAGNLIEKVNLLLRR